MKSFIKSAFFANLLMTLSFIFLAVLSVIGNAEYNAGLPTEFFVCCSIIFLIILPACSTKE